MRGNSRAGSRPRSGSTPRGRRSSTTGASRPGSTMHAPTAHSGSSRAKRSTQSLVTSGTPRSTGSASKMPSSASSQISDSSPSATARGPDGAGSDTTWSRAPGPAGSNSSLIGAGPHAARADGSRSSRRVLGSRRLLHARWILAGFFEVQNLGSADVALRLVFGDLADLANDLGHALGLAENHRCGVVKLLVAVEI